MANKSKASKVKSFLTFVVLVLLAMWAEATLNAFLAAHSPFPALSKLVIVIIAVFSIGYLIATDEA